MSRCSPKSDKLPTIVIPISSIGRSIDKSQKIRSGYLKKHIKNAKELERRREIESICVLVNNWLLPGQSSFDGHLIKQMMKCIKKLIRLMDYKHFKKDLLFPTVIYADRYVKNHGLLEHSEVFHHLLISALIAIKFWQDFGVDMDLTAHVSGISKDELSQKERDFLSTIDYRLFLSTTEIEQYRWNSSSPMALSPTISAP